MSYNLQEQDQIENLREFWSRWGTLISALILITALAWAGFAGLRWWHARQSAEAGALYGQITTQIQAGNLQNAAQAWTDLRARFPDSPYAQMGGLALAKANVDAGKTSDAEVQLRWTAEHAQSMAYRATALLNLSALQADAKDLQAALKTVERSPSPAFDAIFLARRGDIYALMGQREKARDAYEQAIKALPDDASYRQLLQLKLQSVGGSAS